MTNSSFALFVVATWKDLGHCHRVSWQDFQGLLLPSDLHDHNAPEVPFTLMHPSETRDPSSRRCPIPHRSLQCPHWHFQCLHWHDQCLPPSAFPVPPSMCKTLCLDLQRLQVLRCRYNGDQVVCSSSKR